MSTYLKGAAIALLVVVAYDGFVKKSGPLGGILG